MKIIVKYNNTYYYWVDTLTMHDEYDYTCAILVSSKGIAFPVCLDKIEVVDDSYKLKKEQKKMKIKPPQGILEEFTNHLEEKKEYLLCKDYNKTLKYTSIWAEGYFSIYIIDFNLINAVADTIIKVVKKWHNYVD